MSKNKSDQFSKNFNIGDRVLVSKDGGWTQNSIATICSLPESVETKQGLDFWYFVEFESPQKDLSDDGPYYKAQILSRYLSII